MKRIIIVYLLLKSAWKRKLTWFDIRLAGMVRQDHEDRFFVLAPTPTWLNIIANMEQEAVLPEAFAAWWFEIEERWSAWCDEQARKFEEWME